MPIVKLGDVAIEVKETYKGDKTGYPIVGLEHITPEEVTLCNWSNDTKNTFTKMFRKDDILFGRRRAYLKKAAIAPFDGICSGDITVIRAKRDKLYPELLPFVIQNDDFFDYAVEKSAGSLSPRVKWEHLKNYKFKLPSFEKQKKLAELFWSMNDSRNAYQKLLQETDELVKSQFIERFGPYLNNKSKFWEVCIKGPQNGFYRKGAEKSGNVRIIKMKQLFANETMSDVIDCDRVSLLNTELERFRLTSNDLLFGRRSLVVEGAGRCRRVGNIQGDMVFESSILRVSLDENKVRPRYLQCWFDTEDGIKAIVSIRSVTTIAGIKGSDLENMEIPVPPIKFQDDFLDFVKQTDKSKFGLKQAIEKIEVLIKSLVQQELK